MLFYYIFSFIQRASSEITNFVSITLFTSIAYVDTFTVFVIQLLLKKYDRLKS